MRAVALAWALAPAQSEGGLGGPTPEPPLKLVLLGSPKLTPDATGLLLVGGHPVVKGNATVLKDYLAYRRQAGSGESFEQGSQGDAVDSRPSKGRAGDVLQDELRKRFEDSLLEQENAVQLNTALDGKGTAEAEAHFKAQHAQEQAHIKKQRAAHSANAKAKSDQEKAMMGTMFGSTGNGWGGPPTMYDENGDCVRNEGKQLSNGDICTDDDRRQECCKTIEDATINQVVNLAQTLDVNELVVFSNLERIIADDVKIQFEGVDPTRQVNLFGLDATGTRKSFSATRPEIATGSKGGTQFDETNGKFGAELVKYEDASGRFTGDEAKGMKNNLEENYLKVLQDVAAAYKTGKDAAKEIESNRTWWMVPISEQARNLTDLMKKARSTGAPGQGPVSNYWAFLRNVSLVTARKRDAWDPEIEDMQGDLQKTLDGLEDATGKWHDQMEKQMKKNIETHETDVEDSDQKFIDWYKEEQANQILVQKKDSTWKRDFDDAESKLGKLFRDQHVALGKEGQQMARGEQILKKQTRDMIRDREKLSSNTIKQEEKFVQGIVDEDVDAVKKYDKESAHQVKGQERIWNKLLKEVDKTRNAVMKQAENRLELLGEDGFRTRDRAGKARDYLQDLGLQQFSEAGKLLDGVKAAIERHKAAGDTLSNIKRDNLVNNAQLELSHFQKNLEELLETTSTDVNSMTTEAVRGATQRMNGNRATFDRDHSKLSKSLNDVKDHLEYLNAVKEQQDRKLAVIDNTLKEVVPELEKSLSLTDARNGRASTHQRMKDELGTANPLLQDVVDEAKKSRDTLSYNGGSHGAGVKERILDAADGVNTLLAQLREEYAKKAADARHALNERLDALKDAYNTEVTPDGDVAQFKNDLDAVVKRLESVLGNEDEGRVGDIDAVTNAFTSRAQSAKADMAEHAATTDEMVANLDKSIPSRIETIERNQQHELDSLLDKEAEDSTARASYLGDTVLPKRREQINNIYKAFSGHSSGEMARLSKAKSAATNLGRETDDLANDRGPEINALNLKAEQVQAGTKAKVDAFESGADTAIGADLRKAEQLFPPLVDRIVKKGNDHRDQAVADLDALEKKASGDIATSATWMSKSTDESRGEIRKLQDAFKEVKSEFSVNQLRQASAADALSELVKGSAGRLSTIGLATAQSRDQQDAALKAHVKDLQRHADKIFGAGGSGSSSKRELDERVQRAQEQMDAILKDEDLSEDERKAKLDKVNNFLHNEMKRAEQTLAKESTQAATLTKEVQDEAEETAMASAATDGEVRKEMANAEKESLAYEKEGANDLAGELSPAEALLATLSQVQKSLSKMKDADEHRWQSEKVVTLQKANGPFDAALNELRASEKKNAEAIETAKTNQRIASSTVVHLESDFEGSRRKLNSTMHQIGSRLDSEAQALDLDLHEVQEHLHAGSGLVAELSQNVSQGIDSVAEDADTRIEDRREGSEEKEEQLERAEKLEVNVEQDSVAQLSSDARMAWSNHSTLDQGIHAFAARDLAFKDTVSAKLRELRGESADLDSAALRAASSARLGLMDAKHDADKAIEGPVEEAKAEADARMIQIYETADAEIEKLLQNHDLSESERKAAIAKIKQDAKTKAQRLAFEAGQMRREEARLDAEMGRYDAAVQAKRAAIQAKIEAGQLSATADKVQEHMGAADKTVHRQFRRAENAADNLRNNLQGSLVEEEPKYSLAEAAAVFGVPGVTGLEAANDRLEAEDAALERQVAELERRG